MSVVNYSAPFTATPSPLGSSPFYSSRLAPNSYIYPKPTNPFLREDFVGNSRPYPPPHEPKTHTYYQKPPHPTLHQTTERVPPSQVPTQPPGFIKVHGGAEDGVSRVHAVVDYDDAEYYDDGLGERDNPVHVTPIQGPIYMKNGTVPVVPLYSYPTVNNGTFVQIPILWTALSVALGLQISGDYIRGVPCIKKYGQLFCPTAGNSYPLERIEMFIDENKALMRRMYGDFTMGDEFIGGTKRKRSTNKPGVPDLHADPGPDPILNNAGDSYFEKFNRKTRQNFRLNQTSDTGRVDACESKVEIVTPYWASNSAGKIRAIVNTQHFEQAIHQEVCSKARTKRCSDECGCEQKYKWHRLLAYDPDNDCKGIFMDWFLFPSCCVCRCNP